MIMQSVRKETLHKKTKTFYEDIAMESQPSEQIGVKVNQIRISLGQKQSKKKL